MYNTIVETAQEAFEELYQVVNAQKVSGNGTRKVYNVGIKITCPQNKEINTEGRKWSRAYADREWAWYKSEDRSVANIKKYAPIWDKMHGGDNIVNSNYGFLWNEMSQIDKVVAKLTLDPDTRHGWVTLYDGKRMYDYKYDTPCTLSIGFIIEDGLLCMNVYMRSNDLWYGFCNDQYCFSKLQEFVASELKLDVGWYYHHAADMHLYPDFFDRF